MKSDPPQISDILSSKYLYSKLRLLREFLLTYRICFSNADVFPFSADPESEIAPTWFQYYNKELIRTLSFSEHEAFDHPVACKTLNVFFRKSKIVVFGFMLLLIDFSLVYQSKS